MGAWAALVGPASSNPVVLIRESCGVPGNALVAAGTAGGNLAVDPGELVEIRFALTNQSAGPLASISIFVLNTNGVTGSFGAKFITGPIAPGARFEADLTLIPIGSVGDVVRPQVQVVVGAVGTEIVPFEMRLGKEVSNTSVFSNLGAIAVPSLGQGSPFPSVVTVPPSFSGTVSSAKVRLFGVSHARPSDLQILLVSPAGDKVILMNGVGGDISASGVNLVFEPGASSTLGVAGPLLAGTYIPSMAPGALPLLAPAPGPPYSQSFSDLNGKRGDGNWSLYVSDSVTVDGGSISGGWSLELSTSELVSCVSPVTPVLTGAPSGAVSTPEDTPLNVSLNLTDDTTPAQDLVLTVRTSNPTLVPESGLKISGTGSSRTLSIVPQTNRFGAGPEAGSTMTLRLQDKDGFFVERSFRVDVTSVNDAPTISSVPNLPIPIDGVSDEITVNLSDVETEASGLLLFATSSNPALIPDGRVQFSGTGFQRKLTIRPLAAQSGFSTITLAVLDADGGVASTSFLAVVSSPNAFPIISDTGNQSMLQDQSIRLNFTVSDRETPSADLVVTVSATDNVLVPASGLVLGGAGEFRSLTLTPARGMSGHATVTLRVRDSSGQISSDSFELVVFPIAPPPNLPPRLGPVSNKIAGAGQVLVVRLNVQDPDHGLGVLKFTATSDFTSLLPISAIAFKFEEEVWSMVATPSPNQSGTVTIGLKVEDPAGASSAVSFRATFEGSNTAPELTPFTALKLEAGKSSVPIVFNVADQESPFESLEVTGKVLNPALATLEFQGSGFERRLVVKAAGGAGGTSEVVVTVADSGGLSTSASFRLEISPEPVVIPPRISVVLQDGRLELSWPSISAGFILETSTTVSAPTWQSLGSGGLPIGGFHRMTVQADSAEAFFRLRRP